MFGNHFDSNSLKQKQIDIDNRVREVYRRNVALKSIPTVTRNIVLVGRSRSGKSTFKKTLVNPTLVTADMTIFSDTKYAEVQSFLIYGPGSFNGDPSLVCRQGQEENDKTLPLVLNIMATPGLSEKKEGEPGRLDDELVQIIRDALNKEMNKYHAGFFLHISGIRLKQRRS